MKPSVSHSRHKYFHSLLALTGLVYIERLEPVEFKLEYERL